MTALDDLGDFLNADPETDTPAPVPAPKRGRPPKAPGAPVPNSKAKPAPIDLPMPKAGVIADAVAQIYGFGAMGLMAVRPETAAVLMQNAGEIGKAWEAAAVTNPAIRKMLLSLMNTSTMGVLIVAHAPIVMTLMAENRSIKVVKAEPVEPSIPPQPATGPRSM